MLCGSFQCKSSASRHRRMCKACPKIKKLMDDLADANKTIEVLKGLQNQGQTINYVDNRVDNRRQNVNIYCFGDEPKPSSEDVRKLLDFPEDSVSEYMRLKHFAHQDTANMRSKNKRELEIYEEDMMEQQKRGRWMSRLKNDMLPCLTQQNLTELLEDYDAETVEVWRNWYESTDLDKNGYNNTEEFKKITAKIEEIINNNKGQVPL